MSSASYGLVLIFLAAGCALGWYANRSYAAHGDVKSTKRKLPGYRRTRHRSGVVALILAFVIGIVVLGLIKPHP
jgi:ABC-type Fe3+ transport system permease subunit